jgi:hypothetical protein
MPCQLSRRLVFSAHSTHPTPSAAHPSELCHKTRIPTVHQATTVIGLTTHHDSSLYEVLLYLVPQEYCTVSTRPSAHPLRSSHPQAVVTWSDWEWVALLGTQRRTSAASSIINSIIEPGSSAPRSCSNYEVRTVQYQQSPPGTLGCALPVSFIHSFIHHPSIHSPYQDLTNEAMLQSSGD